MPATPRWPGSSPPGCGSATYLGRIIIIVDDDIDITNPAEVMWAVATRWDPKTATDIIDGVLDRLDRPDAAAGAARKRRPHQQPHHHLCGAAVRLEGRVPEGQRGRSRTMPPRSRRKWAGKLKFLDDIAK